MVAASLCGLAVGAVPGLAHEGKAWRIARQSSLGAFAAPVYPYDFPDPDIVDVGGTYYAYATGSGGNLQTIRSDNLTSWSAVSDPLPVLPSWASAGKTWAPGVALIGGTYVMYYTVHDPSLGKQCISVATAATPTGPFSDSSSGPLVCQTADGGSIDPNPYLDPVSGELLLVWKSDDNAIGKPTHIWAQRLAANGLSLLPGSSPSLLLSESAPWQAPAIEGPALVRSGGTYYLFYGANNYDTASSGIGYATSKSLLGPFANRSTSRPWLGSTGNAQGPQGPAIFVDSSGVTPMAFAAWQGPVGYENGGVRSMWIGTLSFRSNGTPELG